VRVVLDGILNELEAGCRWRQEIWSVEPVLRMVTVVNRGRGRLAHFSKMGRRMSSPGRRCHGFSGAVVEVEVGGDLFLAGLEDDGNGV